MFKKMNPEFKAKLVDTMLSGKYTKIEGELSAGRGQYCALGVACRVLRVPQHELVDSGGIPDEKYLNKMGLDEKTAIQIANVNDEKSGEGSFKRVACWIHKNL